MVINRLMRVGFICAILLMGSACADDLPRAQPEAVGFSSERLACIDRFYAEKVQQGEIAGIVTLIARHGKIVHFSAVGYADLEKNRKMQTDAIVRLYSMTKPIAATALMMLYEEGRFQMRDPLSKYLPELGSLRVLRTPDAALTDTVPLERAPTIQDVLRHTAGFTHCTGSSPIGTQCKEMGVFAPNTSLAQMMTKLSQIPLRDQPGTQFTYSIGPDIQARLVEVLSGQPFDQFLKKRLFGPLGMKDTDFWAPPEKAKRLAGVGKIKDGKLVTSEENSGHPEDLDAWSVSSYIAEHSHKGGSIGLVGTAEDYWRFAQMMLNGGELDGVRILSPQTVRYMTLDHLAASGIHSISGQPGVGWGLGFAVLKDPAAAGFVGSEGTFYWGGAASTVFWIDPREDLVVVIMTQHMGVPGVAPLANQIRALVYSALME